LVFYGGQVTLRVSLRLRLRLRLTILPSLKDFAFWKSNDRQRDGRKL
jgi:hypothetical protein